MVLNNFHWFVLHFQEINYAKSFEFLSGSLCNYSFIKLEKYTFCLSEQ